MANYSALVAAWNSTAQPPAGVTGIGLTSTMTTVQKLAAVDAWMVSSTTPIPMIIPTYQIYNLIVGSEFSTLSAANQQSIRDILNMGEVDASPGTQIRARIVGIFSSTTTTFTNLAGLAAKYDAPPVPWWQASTSSGGGGLSSPVTGSDLVAAGNLT